MISHGVYDGSGASHEAEKLWACLKNGVGGTGQMLSTVRGSVGFAETPSFEELVSVYCRCRGISTALDNFHFFLALSYFKLAAISQVILSHLLKCHLLVRSILELGRRVQNLHNSLEYPGPFHSSWFL